MLCTYLSTYHWTSSNVNCCMIRIFSWISIQHLEESAPGVSSDSLDLVNFREFFSTEFAACSKPLNRDNKSSTVTLSSLTLQRISAHNRNTLKNMVHLVPQERKILSKNILIFGNGRRWLHWFCKFGMLPDSEFLSNLEVCLNQNVIHAITFPALFWF